MRPRTASVAAAPETPPYKSPKAITTVVEDLRRNIAVAQDAVTDQLIPEDLREKLRQRLDALSNKVGSLSQTAPDIRRQWVDLTRSIRHTIALIHETDGADQPPSLLRVAARLADIRETAIDAAMDHALDPTPRLPSIPVRNAYAISTITTEKDRGWHPRHLKNLLSLRVLFCGIFCATCIFIDVIFQVLVQHYTNRVLQALPPADSDPLCQANASACETQNASHESLGPIFATTSLDDIGFVALDWMGVAHKGQYADCLVVGSTVASLLLLLPTARGAQALCRWTLLLGSLFFLRGLTIGVTLLPNPMNTCVSKVEFGGHIDSIDPARPFSLLFDPIARKEILWHAINVFSLRDVTCSDVMYSGHTVNSMLASMFAIGFAAGVSKKLAVVTAVRCVFAFLIVATPIMIVATRLHYTCDVLLGGVLTVLSYKLYHTRLALAATCPTSFPLLRRIEGLDSSVCKNHRH